MSFRGSRPRRALCFVRCLAQCAWLCILGSHLVAPLAGQNSPREYLITAANGAQGVLGANYRNSEASILKVGPRRYLLAFTRFTWDSDVAHDDDQMAEVVTAEFDFPDSLPSGTSLPLLNAVSILPANEGTGSFNLSAPTVFRWTPSEIGIAYASKEGARRFIDSAGHHHTPAEFRLAGHWRTRVQTASGSLKAWSLNHMPLADADAWLQNDGCYVQPQTGRVYAPMGATPDPTSSVRIASLQPGGATATSWPTISLPNSDNFAEPVLTAGPNGLLMILRRNFAHLAREVGGSWQGARPLAGPPQQTEQTPACVRSHHTSLPHTASAAPAVLKRIDQVRAGVPVVDLVLAYYSTPELLRSYTQDGDGQRRPLWLTVSHNDAYHWERHRMVPGSDLTEYQYPSILVDTGEECLLITYAKGFADLYLMIVPFAWLYER